MKTAVLLSGEARTFAACFDLQCWQVYRHFDDVEFFVSARRDADAGAFNLIAERFGSERLHLELIDDPIVVSDDRPEPVEGPSIRLTAEIRRAYDFAPYPNATTPEKLLLQHWGNAQVWDNFLHNSRGQFETFIRMRPDNWIHSVEPPALPSRSQCFTPSWGRFGSGVNDRLAIMGFDAASAYFGTYDLIPTLLAKRCPFHPETLVGAALEHHGIDVRHDLDAIFGTLRKPDDPRGPFRPPEIHGWDFLHAALRAA